MSYIELSHVSKEFKVYRRPEGMLQLAASLFHRKYEKKRAVDDLSLSIERGELVGYIGPNGAGKSTTVKMLSGILTPSAGYIRAGGLIPYEDRKKNAGQIGVVFGQKSQLNWDIPVWDSFELSRQMYGVSRKDFLDNTELFTELLEMKDFLYKPVRQLSLGQRMRAELALSLLHDPGILYLDEPTVGLDVVVKDRIRKFIRCLNKEKNTTVILTTHDMKDIQEICTRVVMIDKGRLVLDQPMEEFCRRGGGGLEIDEIVRRLYLSA